MKINTSLKLSSTLLVTLLAANPTYADGFFSKLFGSTSSGSSFNELITHVPANTSYLIANQKAMPKEVIDAHIKRSQALFELISEESKKNKSEPKKASPEAFFSAFMEELGATFKDNKLEESGLSLQSNYLVYGVDTTPVMRLSIADKEKLMGLVKKAEEKSEFKLEMTKCGDFECMVNEDKDAGFALVVLENQLVASVFPVEKKDQMIQHITGKIAEKDAYKVETWEAFLKDNQYTGFGEGFLDLKKLYEKGSPLILGEMQKDKSLSEAELKNCMAVASDHIDNIPEILFGTKALDKDNMDIEILLKTSEGVGSSLKGIANKDSIAKRSENAILDFGINIDFKMLREALTEYSTFLVTSAETNKCKNINAVDIRKGMGGMVMAMNMGLSQFKSVYLSVDDIELDDRMQPEKVDAYVSIGSDDPAGLLAMVGMMSPAMMNFKVPADGSVVKLPEGAIPARGMPVPPILVSRTENTLNLMVGNDKPTLVDYSSKIPEILISGMNSKRYYEKLTQLMPKGAMKPSDESVLKIFDSMGDMAGNINTAVSADGRGLAINYNIEYDKAVLSKDAK